MKMPFTNKFINIMRRNKRRFGDDHGMERALNEAVDLGILPFRDRKKKEFRFKRQGESFDSI